MPIDIKPLWLSFQLALMTTLVLLSMALPLCFWLKFSHSRLKMFIEPLISLPLVLPPTVIGFYLLVALSPSSAFGGWVEQTFGLRLVFSFTGLLIGSVIFSLPFMVNPIKAALEQFPGKLIEAAIMLGKSKQQIFIQVILPNLRPALLTAAVMTFAHTLGEFGVVLMIGGNIPDQTRVASIAIFSEVEALNYHAAYVYSGILLIISFILLFLVHSLSHSEPACRQAGSENDEESNGQHQH